MPIPHLHVLHPTEARRPDVLKWLAEVEALLRSDAAWDRCQFHRHACDAQAGFNVPTVTDQVQRALGPVIVIQKVQQRLLQRLQEQLRQRACIFSIDAACAEDIWQACDAARRSYDDGQPRAPARHAIAYLIVVKLRNRDCWGGTATNKAFLWADDLPKGGFPKELEERREILQVADALVNAGVLTRKKSEGRWKYALGEPADIGRIVETREFDTQKWPQLQKYFDRSHGYVPASLLDYRSE